MERKPQSARGKAKPAAKAQTKAGAKLRRPVLQASASPAPPAPEPAPYSFAEEATCYLIELREKLLEDDGYAKDSDAVRRLNRLLDLARNEGLI